MSSDSSVPAAVGQYQYTALNQLCYAGSANTTACSSPPTSSFPYQFDSADNLNGRAVATTTTDASGNYIFANVVPGTYTITETPPAGYRSTSPIVLKVTVPLAGLTNQNFGNTKQTVTPASSPNPNPTTSTSPPATPPPTPDTGAAVSLLALAVALIALGTITIATATWRRKSRLSQP